MPQSNCLSPDNNKNNAANSSTSTTISGPILNPKENNQDGEALHTIESSQENLSPNLGTQREDRYHCNAGVPLVTGTQDESKLNVENQNQTNSFPKISTSNDTTKKDNNNVTTTRTTKTIITKHVVEKTTVTKRVGNMMQQETVSETIIDGIPKRRKIDAEEMSHTETSNLTQNNDNTISDLDMGFSTIPTSSDTSNIENKLEGIHLANGLDEDVVQTIENAIDNAVKEVVQGAEGTSMRPSTENDVMAAAADKVVFEPVLMRITDSNRKDPPSSAISAMQKPTKSPGSTNKEKWEDNFVKLTIFKAKNGHCRITQGQCDRSFYSWINRQRHLYKAFKQGKKTSLNDEKIKRLNELGFVWNVYDSKHFKLYDASLNGGIPPRPKTWEEFLEELKSYKLLHGDTCVPQSSGAHPDLADWVERQQEAHKQLSLGKESHLTLEKVVKLNCLGFVWEREKVKGVWEKRLEELRKYRSRFGNSNVPEKYQENLPLGKWVANQRQQFYRLRNGRKSHMTETRIKDLNNLNFEWEIKKHDTWNARLNELSKFKEEHGHCNVPLKYTESPKLSFWVRTQREQYRQLREKKRPSNMTEERIRKLEAISFSWALKKQRGPNTKWEDRIKELQQYIIEHGHGNVSHDINPKLANWVTSQRKQRNLFKSGKASSISPERIEALNRIGFEWVVREPQRREDRMRELREYKEEFGNCMVPKRWARNKRLGQWVAEQRKQYRYLMAGKPSHMTPERVVELETVGFVWSLQVKPQIHKPSANRSANPHTSATVAKL